MIEQLQHHLDNIYFDIDGCAKNAGKQTRIISEIYGELGPGMPMTKAFLEDAENYTQQAQACLENATEAFDQETRERI